MNKRICIIQLFRMGDVVQTFPLISALKRENPSVHLTFLVAKAFAPVAQSNENIDEVIIFPWEEYAEQLASESFPYESTLANVQECIDVINKEKYDCVINLQHLFFGPLLSFLINGSEHKGPYYASNKNVHIEDPWTKYFYVISKNRAYNNLNFSEIYMRIGGCSGKEPDCSIPVNSSTQERMKLFLAQRNINVNTDKIVFIQRGASKEYKQWPRERFVKLIDMLVQNTSCAVVLVGSQDEACEDLQLPNNGRIVNAIGETSFIELVELLRFGTMLITNDTGTMHVAAAAGIRSLILSFGMTHPQETAPYKEGNVCLQANADCCPCLDPEKCTHNLMCRDMIEPEDAFLIAGCLIQEKKITSDKAKKYSGSDVYISTTYNDRPRYVPVVKKRLSGDLLAQEIMRALYSEMWITLFNGTRQTNESGKQVAAYLALYHDMDVPSAQDAINEIISNLKTFLTMLASGISIVDSYQEAIAANDKVMRKKHALELSALDESIRSAAPCVAPLALLYDLELRLIPKSNQTIQTLLNHNKDIFLRLSLGTSALISLINMVIKELNIIDITSEEFVQ